MSFLLSAVMSELGYLTPTEEHFRCIKQTVTLTVTGLYIAPTKPTDDCVDGDFWLSVSKGLCCIYMLNAGKWLFLWTGSLKGCLSLKQLSKESWDCAAILALKGDEDEMLIRIWVENQLEEPSKGLLNCISQGMGLQLPKAEDELKCMTEKVRRVLGSLVRNGLQVQESTEDKVLRDIRRTLVDTIDGSRVTYRTAKTYSSFIIDDNNRKCLFKLIVRTNGLTLILPKGDEEQKHQITKPEEVLKFKEEFLEILKTFSNEK